MDLNKLYKETNDKFIGRIENMLYFVCGCDFDRGKIILEECLKRNKIKKEKLNENKKRWIKRY